MLKNLEHLGTIFKGSQDCIVCIWSEPNQYLKLHQFFEGIGYKFVEQVAFVMLGLEKPQSTTSPSYQMTMRKDEEQDLFKLTLENQYTRQSHKSLLMFRRENSEDKAELKHQRNADVILGAVKTQRTIYDSKAEAHYDLNYVPSTNVQVMLETLLSPHLAKLFQNGKDKEPKFVEM